MNLNPEFYRGREQSYIKHLFLNEYIQTAAFKTLQGRSRIFNFVDAFAGPWNVSDEKNYSDASFHQVLHTLEAVRSSLGRQGNAGLKINFCFCETNMKAFEKLRQYADGHCKFQIHVYHGRFENHLDEISNICRVGFTFTFVDPTGWNIDSQPIFQFLKNQHGEFLLNFMSEHINRHARYSEVTASFGRFLADPHWKDDFDNLSSEWNNEQKVLLLLKKNLKSNKVTAYLPDYPILKPGADRVKMRLILGTNSPKGLEVFRDVQFKVEKREIQLRNERKTEHLNQPSLFTDDQILELQQNAIGFGCQSYQKRAEQRIIELLNDQKSVEFERLAIEILENVPIRMTQIKSLVKNMKQQNLVWFKLPPRKHVPQAKTIIELVH